MSKKIQVNFDDDAVEVLDILKKATRGNYGDVIRDAIGLYEWTRQEYEKGNAIGVIKDGVAIQEVILPFTVLSLKHKHNNQKKTEPEPRNRHYLPNLIN